MTTRQNVFTLILVTGLTSLATAQTGRKMVVQQPAPRPSTVTSNPAYTGYRYAQNDVTGSVGLASGAFNMGVTYVKPAADFGVGGYFLMQSSKEKNNSVVVNQSVAFGGLIKLNFVDTNKVRAYVASGFGLMMVKEGSVNAQGKKSDENVIGPTFKIGVQIKATPTFYVGVERMQFANWLNDNLTNVTPTEYDMVAGTFEF